MFTCFDTSFLVVAISVTSLTTAGGGIVKNEGSTGRIVPQFAQLVNTPSGRQLVLSPQPVITPQGGSTTGENNIVDRICFSLNYIA